MKAIKVFLLLVFLSLAILATEAEAASITNRTPFQDILKKVWHDKINRCPDQKAPLADPTPPLSSVPAPGHSHADDRMDMDTQAGPPHLSGQTATESSSETSDDDHSTDDGYEQEDSDEHDQSSDNGVPLVTDHTPDVHLEEDHDKKRKKKGKKSLSKSPTSQSWFHPVFNHRILTDKEIKDMATRPRKVRKQFLKHFTKAGNIKVEHHKLIFEKDDEGNFIFTADQLISNVGGDYMNRYKYFLHPEFLNSHGGVRKRANRILQSARKDDGTFKAVPSEMKALGQTSRSILVSEALAGNPLDGVEAVSQSSHGLDSVRSDVSPYTALKAKYERERVRRLHEIAAATEFEQEMRIKYRDSERRNAELLAEIEKARTVVHNFTKEAMEEAQAAVQRSEDQVQALTAENEQLRQTNNDLRIARDALKCNLDMIYRLHPDLDPNRQASS